jgi:hypothetical protein
LSTLRNIAQKKHCPLDGAFIRVIRSGVLHQPEEKRAVDESTDSLRSLVTFLCNLLEHAQKHCTKKALSYGRCFHQSDPLRIIAST